MGIYLNNHVTRYPLRKLSHGGMNILHNIAYLVDDYTPSTKIDPVTGYPIRLKYATRISKYSLHTDWGMNTKAVKNGFDSLEEKNVIVNLDYADNYDVMFNIPSLYAINVSMLMRIADFHVTCEALGISKKSPDALRLYDLAATHLEFDYEHAIDRFDKPYVGKPINHWKVHANQLTLPKHWVPEPLRTNAPAYLDEFRAF